ncbi:oxidoreductase [Mariniplasma anaerobium]|uniref:Short-chain dehydrogenase n=1 Tax=Mariniplasma anaerobium TaxID=2735436 RepID=A0A7U9TJ38_9MOLU|nr:oxidoreductase [Mariniplasma anaerobium]BCR35754.1 short-chain dehydrogenase [Mariniplasma anaerobium]
MKNIDFNITEIKDLNKKIIIVTGANSGLGLEATKIFASKGATIIMACRSIERANEARDLILKENKNAKLVPMDLDLGSLKSIKAFAKDFKNKYDQLDILLNNAGVMTIPYGKTTDGFEIQNGVNHLGHFALTAQLFDVIKQTKASRIVNVSSLAHRQGKMDFDNYLFEKGGYKKMKSYAKSKLSNLLFTYELDRKIKEKGYDIKVLAAHPGVSSTNLGRHIQGKNSSNPFLKFALRFGQPPHLGCLPEVRAALDENAQSGQYYGPSGLTGMKGRPVIVKSSKRSHNINDAKTLWNLSETLTHVKFEV